MVSESWSESAFHGLPDDLPGDRAGEFEGTGGSERDPASDLGADRRAEPLHLLLVADQASMTEGAQRQLAAFAAALARAGYAVTLACAPGGEPQSPAD